MNANGTLSLCLADATHYIMPPEARDHIRPAAPDFSPYTDIEDFLDLARHAHGLIPAELQRLLAAFKNNPAHPGHLLVQDLPSDDELDLPDTPPHGERPDHKHTFVSEFAHLVVA